jgi:hypothetical protein
LNKRDLAEEELMNKKRYLVIAVVVAAAMLFLAPSCTTPTNHWPIITSLEAEPEIALPGGSCLIVCNAIDPDGDELSYNWSDTGGAIAGRGAKVAWYAPNSVGSYNATVTVTDVHGGKATKQITITVRTNEPPEITSLIADADWTTPSGSLQVTCNATDPDGDELSYTWSASEGNITDTGPEVIWSAPEEVGIYDVTVSVTDVLGWSDTKSIALIASNGPPPTIEKLVVTAKGNSYLKKSIIAECDYDVWINKEYDIECVASNTSSELFYDWSCTAGSISGAGSRITWTAPNKTSVKVTVTVTVSDAAGDSIGKNIVFYIPSGSCGF